MMRAGALMPIPHLARDFGSLGGMLRKRGSSPPVRMISRWRRARRPWSRGDRRVAVPRVWVQGEEGRPCQ